MYTRDSFQFFSAKELLIHTQRALNVQPAHQTCRAKYKHRLMLQQIKVDMHASLESIKKKKAHSPGLGHPEHLFKCSPS